MRDSLSKKRVRLKAGDIFEIPLSDARKAYGQFVFADDKNGPLIQVFDLITEERIDLERLKEARPLFPPVITGLRAAIRSGLWTLVGHSPVIEFTYPEFISPQYVGTNGETGNWCLWDGKKYTFLGRDLPEEYRQLEILVVWSPHDVVHRIETGETSLDSWRNQ